MKILYSDKSLVVCQKPPRVLSTNEPGGVPDLVREALHEPKGDVRTVHRLDRVVGGLMVLARNSKAASALSAQIREGSFEKRYCAVVHGVPEQEKGTLRDLLIRDKARKMTFITQELGKGVQDAVLHYEVLERTDNISLVSIQLETGRTHQIRVQFSGRGLPLVGERKYAELEDDCELALWSCGLAFAHPATGERMEFFLEPPKEYPWNCFGKIEFGKE